MKVELREGRQRPPAARLLIVDDHDLARAGLRSMLAAERGLEVVGEAVNGRQAVARCACLRPDLVLMDIRMPDLDGLAATGAIKRESPATSIIIVTMYEDADYLFEALKAGAAGYVLKGAPKGEIVSTVRRVLRGELPLDPRLATQLLRRLADQAQEPAMTPATHLTRREREVLRLLALGKTNPEIACELTVGLSTVKTHVQHIIAKLGVSDRTQAAVRAVELGLLTSGEA